MDLGAKKKTEDILDLMAIGKRIRKLRGKESRSTFAKRFNIGINTLTRYEAGDTLPDSHVIAIICKHFNVASDWILFSEEDQHQSTSSSAAPLISYLNGPTTQERVIEQPAHALSKDAVVDSLLSLPDNNFHSLWLEYCNDIPPLRGWLQVEIVKRFPEFVEWCRKKRPSELCIPQGLASLTITNDKQL
jgi:transcriptional regulator with XRE-family HTH domain